MKHPVVKIPTSYSGLSELDNCPRLYYLDRVVKEEPRRYGDVDVYELGKKFHERVVVGFGQLIKNKPTFDPLVMSAALDFPPDLDPLLTQSWHLCRCQMTEWLTNHRSLVEYWLAGEVWLERPFALDSAGQLLEWEGGRESPAPENLAVRGYIDAAFNLPTLEVPPALGEVLRQSKLKLPLTQTAAGNWRVPYVTVVVDWKTSSVRFKPLQPNGEPHPQLLIYAWAIFCLNPHTEYVLTSFMNVRLGMLEQLLIMPRDYVRRVTPAWIKRVQEDVNGRDPYNVEDWEPVEGPHCRGCGYRHKCPIKIAKRFANQNKKKPLVNPAQRSLFDLLDELGETESILID